MRRTQDDSHASQIAVDGLAFQQLVALCGNRVGELGLARRQPHDAARLRLYKHVISSCQVRRNERAHLLALGAVDDGLGRRRRLAEAARARAADARRPLDDGVSVVVVAGRQTLGERVPVARRQRRRVGLLVEAARRRRRRRTVGRRQRRLAHVAAARCSVNQPFNISPFTPEQH